MSGYIVKTTRHLPSTEDHSTIEYVERHVVDTLDEVEGYVVEWLCRLEQHAAVARLARRRWLTESGATVELPDGTVIEVTPA